MNASADKARNLVGQSALLYVATHLAIVFKFVGGFLVAGMLGPALYGLRNVFGLVVEYEYFSHAGTLDAMRKEVPYRRGRGELAQAERTMNNVFTANMLYAVTVALVLIGAAMHLHRNGYASVYVDFTVFLAAYIVLAKVRLFYDTRLLVDKRAEALGKARVLYQFFGALFSVVLVFHYSLRGLFIGLFLAELLTVGYLLYLARALPRIELSRVTLRLLLSTGLPIMLIGLAFVLLRSVDRIVIAAMLPHEMLGYFGIATIVSGLIYMTLSDVTVAVFFPRLMEKVGGSRDSAELKSYMTQPTLLIAYLVPFVIGVLFLAIHIPLRHWLPEYSPAISVSQILILSSFCFCVSTIPLLVCIALDKQARLLLFTVGAVLLDAALACALISAGFGIHGVAVGTTVAQFTFSVFVVSYALQQFGEPAPSKLRFLATIYAPFLYAAGLLIALDQGWRLMGESLSTDVLLTAAKTCLFILAFSLVLVPMRRHVAFRRLAGGLPMWLRPAGPEMQ